MFSQWDVGIGGLYSFLMGKCCCFWSRHKPGEFFWFSFPRRLHTYSTNLVNRPWISTLCCLLLHCSFFQYYHSIKHLLHHYVCNVLYIYYRFALENNLNCFKNSNFFLFIFSLHLLWCMQNFRIIVGIPSLIDYGGGFILLTCSMEDAYSLIGSLASWGPLD